MKKVELDVWTWVLRTAGVLAKALEKPAEICIKIVNAVKEYIFNPGLDLLAALTNTSIDNKIIELVRKVLPGIIEKMMIGEGIIKSAINGDLTQVLEIFSKFLAGLAAENRGKWWADLTALLLPIISGRNVDKALSMSVTQGVYLKMPFAKAA